MRLLLGVLLSAGMTIAVVAVANRIAAARKILGTDPRPANS